MKPWSEVIEVNFEELAGLLERARQGPLGEEDCQRLEAAIQALSYLIEKIGEKDTTISRLRALLAKPSTEKTSKVLEQAGIKVPPQNPPPPKVKDPPKPGHGRNGAKAYGGAEADQNHALFVEAWGPLSGVFERKSVRPERPRAAHPGGGPSADCGQSLRVRTSAL